MRTIHFELNFPEVDGCFDRAEIDPAGIVRLIGWLRGPVSKTPEVSLDEEKLRLLQTYRLARPDVEGVLPDLAIRQPGVVFEYLVTPLMVGRAIKNLSIVLPSGAQLHFEGEFTFLKPHYRELFVTDRIYHRDSIYGSGPSNLLVNPEVMALAKTLPGPVLDFGCGSGALVAELKALGTEVRGLELNTKQMRKSIKAEVRTAVTLYDGTLPLELPDRAFRAVFCSEVLEHIPDPRRAVKEISRLAAEQAIFTVPDASAIPLGFRHSLVPWHLLEGTHVNFFTQHSLQLLLQPFFTRIEFGRIGACDMNDSQFFTSLVAFCRK